VLRRLSPLLRRDDGFGLIELMIAMTMLAIGISALGGLFISGHLALRRATQADSASALADKLLERFRAEKWDGIALNASQFSGTDTTYQGDSVYSSVHAVTASTGDCSASPVPVACNPSRLIPDTTQTPTEVAPDGRQYRIDTYVNWGCATSGDTLDMSSSPPVCKDSGGNAHAYTQTKIVTVVVRDDTNGTVGAALYRTSSTFDRLSGDSIPQSSVTSTTSGSDSSSSTSSGSVPDAPTLIALANGGGNGNQYINSGNATGVNIDVTLPSTSLPTDTITLKVTGSGAPDQTFTLPGSPGGTLHFTGASGNGINVSGFADGVNAVTFSVSASNTNGTSAAPSVMVTKDTVAPAPPTSVSLGNGQGTGNAFINSATKSAVTVNVGVGSTSVITDTIGVALSVGAVTTNPATAPSKNGSGTVTLTGINASSLADGVVTISATATDAAGNTSSATTNTAGVAKDATPPTLTLTRVNDTPNALSSVQWTATFSESVSGVAANDFTIVKSGLSGSLSITGVSGSGSTYTITASTGTGSGTIGLNLTSAGSIADTATNAPAVPVTGAVYTIDRSPPTLTIALGGTSPTNASTAQWTVTFNKSVTGVVAGNFSTVSGGGLGGTPTVTSVTGTGTTYTVTATAGTGSGTLGLNLTSAGSIQDSVGNPPATPVTGAVYTIDRTAPTAAITLAGTSPTSASTAQWTVTFSKSVTSVATGNFSAVSGGGLTGTPSVTSVTGSGTTYTVTATTGTGSGTLGLNLTSAGSIKDTAGNAPATPVTGAIYTVDRGAPTVTSVTLVNGGTTAGKVEKADQIKIVFSETMSVSSFCSTWSGNAANQSISGSNVVITLTDGTASSDSVTVSTTSGCTFNFGSISLGSNAYISGGGATFSGTGSNASSIAWTASTHTLTITLGAKSGTGTVATISSSTATYTPSTSIQDASGNAVSGTGSTGAVKNF
jgi:prepilin-type N-terminal cleavage/methylation domain-containing protein